MVDGNYEPRVIAESEDGNRTLVWMPNQPTDDAVQLTLMHNGYDGNPLRIEVMTNSSPSEDVEPGLWIQAVEGCGYDTDYQTPEQAEELAISIEKERQWTSRPGTGQSAHVPTRTYPMTQIEAALVADLLRKGAEEARNAKPL